MHNMHKGGTYVQSTLTCGSLEAPLLAQGSQPSSHSTTPLPHKASKVFAQLFAGLGFSAAGPGLMYNVHKGVTYVQYAHGA